jgi:hypothetical protein
MARNKFVSEVHHSVMMEAEKGYEILELCFKLILLITQEKS